MVREIQNQFGNTEEIQSQFDEAEQYESENTDQIIHKSKQVEAEEREDPRLQEGGGGFRGALKEVQSALAGGIQDTASSLATFPERTIDMFSG